MNVAEAGLAAARAAAEVLLGGAVDRIERVSGAGRNSKVFLVQTGDQRFALKQYPSRRDDPRNRLETEFRALELMTRHGFRNVPQAVARDAELGYGLIEWVEGEAVTAPTSADVDAAVEFLAAIHALRSLDEARLQPPASEACVCGAEVVAQIERRLSRLAAVSANEPMLHALIEEELRPLLFSFVTRAEAGYANRQMQFAVPIAAESQTLCPSDFGFHNTLRAPGGELHFLDFDYFGWDDPAKLVADFLLHPGMSLSDELKQRFFAGTDGIYGADPGFRTRLRLLLPLFGLRWCLILLNEFLPERWSIRQQVGMQFEWAEVKQRQTGRVRQLLQILKTEAFRFLNDG